MILAHTSWAGEGPPIVAVHGLSSNASFFVGVAERLAGRRPLLSLDLRGRGRSDKPDSGYGMAQHADDVVATMAALGTGPAVVVGHSMGATVALTVGQFLEAGRGIEGRLTMTFDSAAAYADHWRGLGIFPPDGWGPWVDDYLAADVDGPADGLQPRCSSDAVAQDVADLLATASAPVDPVAVPVLAIAASDGLIDGTSPLVPEAAFTDMAAAFPSFRSARLPGTNHYTVALADPGATITADLLVEHAIAAGR